MESTEVFAAGKRLAPVLSMLAFAPEYDELPGFGDLPALDTEVVVALLFPAPALLLFELFGL